jgi:hypothetical protein
MLLSGYLRLGLLLGLAFALLGWKRFRTGGPWTSSGRSWCHGHAYVSRLFEPPERIFFREFHTDQEKNRPVAKMCP